MIRTLALPLFVGYTTTLPPPHQRLRCVLGMLNSLEVKVLWPT